jgi:hypothetical protein
MRGALIRLLALLIVLAPAGIVTWQWSGMAGPAAPAPDWLGLRSGDSTEMHYLDDSAVPACQSGQPTDWQTPGAPQDTTRSLEPLLHYSAQQNSPALQTTTGARESGQALLDLRTDVAALSQEERITVAWLLAGSLCALWLLVQNWDSVPDVGAATWMRWVFLGLVIGPLAFWLCRRNGLAAR